jgi:Na+/melibiose symporter-like transporter
MKKKYVIKISRGGYIYAGGSLVLFIVCGLIVSFTRKHEMSMWFTSMIFFGIMTIILLILSITNGEIEEIQTKTPEK